LLSGFVGCFLLAGKSAGRALPVWREEIPTLALLIGLLCLLWSLFVFDFVRPIHISRSGDQESSTNVQSLSLSVCASFLEGLREILRILLFFIVFFSASCHSASLPLVEWHGILLLEWNKRKAFPPGKGIFRTCFSWAGS
jgi:hypothetical protein